MRNMSQWSKDVKKALIDRGMTLDELGETIGYRSATISAVLGGRYANATCDKISSKINDALGTVGRPERTTTPSDEWRCAVKCELIKRNMTMTELADKLDISRDRMSLVINGKMMNDNIVSMVSETLGISTPAIPVSHV